MGHGVTNDYFALASNSGIELNGASKNPSYANEATSEDENGGIVCTTKSGESIEVSNTYNICGGGDTNGDHNLDTYAKVGEVITEDTNTHYLITSLGLTCDNKNDPVLTVTGIKEPGTTAGTHPTFTSGIVIRAAKQAKAYGIGTVTGKVTASSINVGGSVQVCEDSVGDAVKREVYGVKMTASNTLTACSGAPTAPADTANGWGLESPVGLNESNTAYADATVAVYKNVLQDT